MRRNVAGQAVQLRLIDKATGDPVTTGASVRVKVISGGTGSWANGLGALSHDEDGSWEYLPTQAETDGETCVFKIISASGIVDQAVYDTRNDLDATGQKIKDVEAVVRANVLEWLNLALAGDNMIEDDGGGNSRWTSKALEQGPAGSGGDFILETTIASAVSSDTIRLTDGPAVDGALRDHCIQIYITPLERWVTGTIAEYTGATKECALARALPVPANNLDPVRVVIHVDSTDVGDYRGRAGAQANAGATTLDIGTTLFGTDTLAGSQIALLQGTGDGQVRQIIANSGSAVTIDRPLVATVPNDSMFVIRVRETRGTNDALDDVAAVVTAVWSEPQAGYTTADTFGSYLDSKVSEAGGGATSDVNVVSWQGVALSGTPMITDGAADPLWTTRSLENAPGGSGGITDWTVAEREQIRDALGVDGAKTEAVGGQLQLMALESSVQTVITTGGPGPWTTVAGAIQTLDDLDSSIKTEGGPGPWTTGSGGGATPQEIWEYATRELTSAAKITSTGGEITLSSPGVIAQVAHVDAIAGTITTLDALDASIKAAGGAGPWTTADVSSVTVAAIESGAVQQIWNEQLTESYAAAGVVPTGSQALLWVHQTLDEKANAGTTGTIGRITGGTAGTVAYDDPNNPASVSRST